MKRLLAAFVLLSVLNGCAPVRPGPSAQPRLRLALENETAEAIDQFLLEEMRSRHIAGLAAAVIVNGEVRYGKGFGFADVARGIPVRRDTPFLIASLTKMFTAVGTMLLVQGGRVQLDAPIGQYVEDLPAHWHRATVRQLLAHTAGISSFTSHERPPCGRTADERDYTQQDVIAEVACLPLDFEPGTDWSYSDTGYFLLGLLIQRVSGLSYEQYLRERIFSPLGMHSTRLIGPMGSDDGRAVGYRWDGQSLVLAPPLSPVIEGPSGGLVSTLDDLARFDSALANDRLLPQPVLRTMWRPLRIGTAMYGLGFAVWPIDDRPQVGHTGGGPGAATSFARFAGDGLTVIVLTNTAQPPFSIQEIVGGITRRVLEPGAE